MLLVAFCLVVGLVSAAPRASSRANQRQRPQESQLMEEASARESSAFTEAGIDADEKNDPVDDESVPADPEFNDGPSGAQERSDASDEDSADSQAGAASNLRWSDRALLDTQDTNIANAKVRLSSSDMATAAGHHHHKKHYVSGWLKMGAETGKKGAFKWHDKHPVGGKGRR